MTLQQLRYVIAVAKYRSINEAASALYVSQPAISNAIKDLELEFNILIFTRNNRGIELTPKGVEFIGYARQVVESAACLNDKFTEGRKETIRFAVSCQHYSFAVSAFIKLVNLYGIDKYDFCIRETRTLDILDDVHNLTSNVGIIYISDYNKNVIMRELKERQLEFKELILSRAHAFIAQSSPFAKNSVVSLSDLKDYPFLCFEQGANSTDFLAEELLANDNNLKTIRVSDRGTLFNLLIGLNGYTISSGIIENELDPEVVAVPLKEHAEMRIGLVQRKGIVPSDVTNSYINFLKEVLKIN